jgi:phosphoribosylformylglycinamidine (FGAM) synthase-like enzyme
MDLKEVDNLLLLVGETRNELGGSHWAMVRGLEGGNAPRVDLDDAPRIFRAVHKAISRGLVRSCHDLSEGGLAVALAEMAIAGGLGARVVFAQDPPDLHPASLLFSESPTRFLLEVRPEATDAIFEILDGLTTDLIGGVIAEPRLVVLNLKSILIDASLPALKEAWQAPLCW